MEAFMNWKVAGMACTAIAAVALTGVSATAGANKFTGNVSLAVGQSFEDDDIGFSHSIFDDSFTSITGQAEINVAFTSNLNLQGGFIGTGAFNDDNSNGLNLDRDAGFQGDAHLYWRTDRYAAGVFVGGGVASGANFNNFPFFNAGERTAEYYFVGAEAQYYWKNFTFGVNGGYLDSSTDSMRIAVVGPDPVGDNVFLSDAWFVNGEVRWYASQKFALSANVGYISGEARLGQLDVDTLHWGAKAEYWPEEKEPLSLWIAYEGRTSDFDYAPTYFAADFEKDVHTIKIGVTFHFGVDGTAEENDRGGPAWNTMDYGAIVVGG
jgi:hypothetical protein